MSRLTTPDDQTGMDYVVGCKKSRYFVPTISHVDDQLKNLTARLNRWVEAGKFPDLVETLATDRDLLLDRRSYLALMAPEPPADDRGLIR